jgi:hypothetical protein
MSLDLHQLRNQVLDLSISHGEGVAEHDVKKSAIAFLNSDCAFGDYNIVLFGHARDSQRRAANKRFVLDLLVEFFLTVHEFCDISRGCGPVSRHAFVCSAPKQQRADLLCLLEREAFQLFAPDAFVIIDLPGLRSFEGAIKRHHFPDNLLSHFPCPFYLPSRMSEVQNDRFVGKTTESEFGRALLRSKSQSQRQLRFDREAEALLHLPVFPLVLSASDNSLTTAGIV